MANTYWGILDQGVMGKSTPLEEGNRVDGWGSSPLLAAISLLHYTAIICCRKGQLSFTTQLCRLSSRLRKDKRCCCAAVFKLTNTTQLK